MAATEAGVGRYMGLTLLFYQKGRWSDWVGECLETGTATSHEFLDKLKAELAELTILHVNSLEDIGEIDHFLDDNGIILHPQIPLKVNMEIPVANMSEDHLYRPLVLLKRPSDKGFSWSKVNFPPVRQSG